MCLIRIAPLGATGCQRRADFFPHSNNLDCSHTPPLTCLSSSPLGCLGGRQNTTVLAAKEIS